MCRNEGFFFEKIGKNTYNNGRVPTAGLSILYFVKRAYYTNGHYYPHE